MLSEQFDCGKYTVILKDDGTLVALRHGQPWRDLTGDGLALSMLQEAATMRAKFRVMLEASKARKP